MTTIIESEFEYKVICNTSQKEFQKEVEEHINKGWVLTGGVSISYEPRRGGGGVAPLLGSKIYYAQALWGYKNEHR